MSCGDCKDPCKKEEPKGEDPNWVPGGPEPTEEEKKAHEEKMKKFLDNLPKEVRDLIEKRSKQAPTYGDYVILDKKYESLWEGDEKALRERFPDIKDEDLKEFTKKVSRVCKQRKERLLISGREWEKVYPEQTVLEKNIERYTKERDDNTRFKMPGWGK